jgi:hypothetical protein
MSGFLDAFLPTGMIDMSGLREDAGVPDDFFNTPENAPPKDGLEAVVFFCNPFVCVVGAASKSFFIIAMIRTPSQL